MQRWAIVGQRHLERRRVVASAGSAGPQAVIPRRMVSVLRPVLGVRTHTGCLLKTGALVFEEVRSGETRRPILRNRGPIRRNSVSPDRTSCFSFRKQGCFDHLEQHLNAMSGSCLIANFLPCSRGSPEITTGSYAFEV